MDPTIIAAIIGAIATISAAFAGPLLRRRRRVKGQLLGSIDELVLTVDKNDALAVLKALISQATEIRIAGWSLLRTMDELRHPLREFVSRGGRLYIIVLDPAASAVESLDEFITDSDPIARAGQSRPAERSRDIARLDIKKVLRIVHDNDLTDNCRLTKYVLPIGLFMVNCKNGKDSWASVQLYPLNPDLRVARRLAFAIRGENSDLWKTIKEQFDILWGDTEVVSQAEK